MSDESTASADGSKRWWRIGDVSRSSGVSVRMLRHYDEIGLLAPSGYSEGGHREYSTRDVLRLDAIVALRTLGFSLAEVKALLDGVGDPRDLVTQQVAVLDETLEVMRTARARLLLLQDRLEHAEEPALEEFLTFAGMLARGRARLDAAAAQDLFAARRATLADMSEAERTALWARHDEVMSRLGADGRQVLAVRLPRPTGDDHDERP